MATVSYSVNVSGGTQSLSAQKIRTADGGIDVSPTLPVGKSGTLSTRTDDDTGVITATAHGLSVSDVVDIFWTGGRRYGMIVSSVADANNVTVGTGAGDVGAGDVFPIATTAVVITERVQVNVSIDGDALSILAVKLEYTDSSATSKGHASFQDVSSGVVEEVDLEANAVLVWDITGGATNVFTGNPITKVMATNGSSSAAATLRIVGAVDATP